MNYAGKFDGKIPFDASGLNSHGHVETFSQHATHVPSGAIIVPDAQLLFNGDFKRSGVDLILSKDDHELVLQDYFKGEKRAALSSPDGAHLTGDIVNALTGHTQYAQADGSASVGKVIGHVTKLVGTATAIRNGVSIVLNMGDNVEKGDVVQSGSDSRLGITFIDGTVFGLGSSAKMVLNEMVYDPNGSNNSSLLSLVQGTITFVAGETAKHGDMKVDTPVATMGIRGTAVLVEIDFVIPGALPVPNAPPPPPSANFQVLVEPDGTTGSYVLFDKTTLAPLATVNLAGTQTSINGQGVVNFMASAPLSADAQKLITDVFTQRFTDNSDSKTTTAQNDTITPQSGSAVKLANGDSVTPTLFVLNLTDHSSSSSDSNNNLYVPFIGLPPNVVAVGGSSIERPGVSHSSATDTVSGTVNFTDINATATPTVTATFATFTLQNAQHSDITAALTTQQLAAVAAVEVPISVVPASGNNNNGSATLTYSMADGAFDFLAANETLTLIYSVTVNDGRGGVVSSPFSVTITGTNDTPVLAADTAPHAIAKLGTGNSTPDIATGSLTFTDVDLSDAHSVASSLVSATWSNGALPSGLSGTLAAALATSIARDSSNGATGNVAFTFSAADSVLGFLSVGQTLTVTYDVTVDDGHGGSSTQPVTLIITGTNNAPTIVAGSTTATGAIGEIAATTGSTTSDSATGSIAFADVNLSDTHTVSQGTPTFVWSGGTLSPGQIAALTSASTLALTKTDSTGTGSGSVAWNYSAQDKSFDFLAAGQTLTVTYAVTVDDGHGGSAIQNVVVTVTGTDDAAVITGTDTQNLTETNAILTTDGVLSVSDVDSAATFIAQSGVEGSGGFGKFTITTAGVWHYTTDTAHNEFVGGTTYTDTLTVSSADGTTHLLTVHILGTNDAAVITGTDTQNLTETNAILTTGGVLSVSDVDSAATFIAQSGVEGSGGFGKFTINAAGVWSYVTDTAHNDFVGGTTYTDTLTVSSADGTTHVLTVNILGTNDAAVIAGTDTQNLTETNAILTTGGALSVSDVDSAATFVAQTGVEGSGGFGKFSINAAGVWSYVTDTAHTEFVGGTTYTDTLTVSSADGTTHVLTVHILGTNDAAVIAGTDTQNLTETNAVLNTGGVLSVSDVDSAATFIAQSGVEGSGGFGKFSINAAGVWSYVTDTAHNEFVGGTTYTDTLTVSSADGTTHVLTVHILGTNDAAVIGGTSSGTVVEAGGVANATPGTPIATGTLTDTDVDSTPNTFIAAAAGSATANSYGTYQMSAAGVWTYTLNNSNPTVQALNVSQHLTDTFTVNTIDGTAQVVTITINGTNDAAVISGKSSGNVEIPDDGPGSGKLTDTGTLTDTDVDNTPNTFIAAAAGSATDHGYGTYQMTAAGVWTYTLNYSNSTVRGLDEGQHVTDTFTVHTVDGTAKVVTVTVSDDDPVTGPGGPAGVAGSEINLGLVAAPPDPGSLVTVTVADLPSGWSLTGGVQVDDHTWTIQTSDVQTLTVTPSSASLGAVVLEVSESWTKPDGTTASALVADNVESYAVGSPIFALTANDYLTGSSGSDLFVFGQPISHDVIYSFNSASDKIDLVGFNGFADFNDVAAHLSDDGAGNTVLTLASDETITLHGVNSTSLSAGNFEFNQQTVLENSADMIIGNGAKLPLSGMIENAGVIELNSTGGETDLQLISGATLHGGGQIVLSDSDANIISGTSSSVTLNNEDNTVSGAGQLGNGELSLTNAGTINATGTHVLNIDTGSSIILNSGVLEASGSGGMTVASAIANSGILWANGATLTVQGAVSGNGTATIDGAGTLDFEASSTANVVFGAGAAGTLKLQDSFHFSGTISGFEGSDMIDLANLGSATASFSYHENATGTGGTLAISDGAQTVELSLLGQYSADNFRIVPDHLHGTLVTYVPHDLVV